MYSFFRKFRHFLTCYSVASMFLNRFKLARDLLNQISEFDYPMDTSQSFSILQPSPIINDVEVYLIYSEITYCIFSFTELIAIVFTWCIF